MLNKLILILLLTPITLLPSSKPAGQPAQPHEIAHAVEVPLSIRPSESSVQNQNDVNLQPWQSSIADLKESELIAERIPRIQQSVEQKERESKETEPDDILATPEQLEEMKNTTRKFGAFAFKGLPWGARWTEEMVAAEEKLINGWASNKVTRRIFQALDAQLPNEEIIKLFKGLQKGTDICDQRKLYSVFETQQELVNICKNHTEASMELLNQTKQPDRNSSSQNPLTIYNVGKRQYLHRDIKCHLMRADDGITPLMKVSSQGNEELVEFLLCDRSNLLAITGSAPWMAEDDTFKLPDGFDEIHIKLKGLFAYYLRDTVSGYHPDTVPTLSEAFDSMVQRFLERYDALSLATLAGHPRIVDRLLKQLKDDYKAEKAVEFIKNALLKLTAFSDPATADCARGLLASLGIVEPKRENYLAIAQILIRAFIETMPKCRYGTELQDLYEIKAHKEILNLFIKVMTHGSPEMFEVIAQELAHCDLHPEVMEDEAATPGKFVDGHLCGEKLGILFSIAAEKQSMLSIIRSSLLEAAPKNSAFLARLQQFVREQQMMPTVETELNQYLPPVLAPIVRDYITLHRRAPEPELCAHILALRPNSETVPPLFLRRNSKDEKKQ